MYKPLIYFIFGSAAAAFLGLLFLTAPYGRYVRRGWGPSVRARWAWIIMELPAVFVIFLVALTGNSDTVFPVFFLVLWEIHYVYRTFLYPSLMRSAKKEFPASLVLMAIIFNAANGYVNGWHLFRSNIIYSLEWAYDIRFIIGIILYICGFIIHVNSDGILRNLRQNGDTEYKVPQGGVFSLVSAPNYFGEMVQWFGWALATWSLAGLAFAAFTAANLLPRALSHHTWYKNTFPGYPKKRRAVIPFLL